MNYHITNQMNQLTYPAQQIIMQNSNNDTLWFALFLVFLVLGFCAIAITIFCCCCGTVGVSIAINHLYNKYKTRKLIHKKKHCPRENQLIFEKPLSQYIRVASPMIHVPSQIIPGPCQMIPVPCQMVQAPRQIVQAPHQIVREPLVLSKSESHPHNHKRTSSIKRSTVIPISNVHDSIITINNHGTKNQSQRKKVAPINKTQCQPQIIKVDKIEEKQNKIEKVLDLPLIKKQETPLIKKRETFVDKVEKQEVPFVDQDEKREEPVDQDEKREEEPLDQDEKREEEPVDQDEKREETPVDQDEKQEDKFESIVINSQRIYKIECDKESSDNDEPDNKKVILDPVLIYDDDEQIDHDEQIAAEY